MTNSDKEKDQIRLQIKDIYDILDDKQGENIVILDISQVSILSDYFIIVTGKNKNHLQTLVDSVDEKLKEKGIFTLNTEGSKESGWVLLDYGDIILHIFSEEQRSFYDLESLWADAKKISLD